MQRLVLAAALAAAVSGPARADDGDDSVIVDDAVIVDDSVIEIVERPPRPVAAPVQHDLPREELEVIPGAHGDAVESVKSLPGVGSVNANGFTAGHLIIRGASPEDSTYLVDGIPVPSVTHFGGLQSILPSELIDDVELLPGGFDVEYGRATGGVVQIHTRPTQPTELRGFAELSFITVAGFVEGPLSKRRGLSFAVAARRSLIDAVLPAVLPDDSAVSFSVLPFYYDAQARLDWRPGDRHRVSALVFTGLDRLSLLVDTENDLDPNLSGTFDGADEFWRGSLAWHYTTRAIDNRAIAWVSASFSDQTIGPARFFEFDGRGVAARDDLRWRARPWLTLRTGGDVQLYRADIAAVMPLPPDEGVPGEPNFTTDPVATYDGRVDDVWSSAYAAADVRLTADLTVTPGLRFDYFRHLRASTLSPRLSAHYDVGPRWTARAAVGHYTRPVDGADYVAPGLRPESAIHTVAGAEWRPADGVSVSASAFYTDLHDLVVRDPMRLTDGGNALDVYVNGGTGASKGIELLGKVRRDGLFAWVAYTLSRTTRVDGARMDERLSDFDQTHNLVAVGSWQLGPWRFGARWQYATGAPETPVVGAIYDSDRDIYDAQYGAANSRRLEAAHQLDLRVDRRWVFDAWSLAAYLDVTNVYAHAQTLGYSYSFDYSEREPQTTPPILPSIGVRGEF